MNSPTISDATMRHLWQSRRRLLPAEIATVLALMALCAGTGGELLSPEVRAQAPTAVSVAKSLVIRNARIFDGAQLLPASDLWMEEGRIKAMGTKLDVPAGLASMDATGDTLLPGLIDAHTHAYQPDHLRAALIFGVTTELDMFTSVEFAQRIKGEEADGGDTDMADLRSAEILVMVPGGHGTEYGLKIPTISGPAEAQEFVDARIAEGSDYIKIILDNGSAYGVHIPTISKETMAAVIAAAHKRGKMAVVHIGSAQGAHEAIEAGADGLMHTFTDAAPDPHWGEFVAAHHAFVVPTLSVNESITGTPSGASLVKDPRMGAYIMPMAATNLNRGFPRITVKLDFANALESVRLMHASGVPILAGSDAPNPGTAHGASMHRELELLVKAGLTPTEALAAATSVPAKTFHLEDRGVIAAGKRADLLLVKGDPTQDITATRDIVAVWKVGVQDDRETWRGRAEKLRVAASTPPAGSKADLVSDFEGAQPTTTYGAGWLVSTDSLAGGKSVAVAHVVPGGAHGSKGALQISGTVDGGLPYAWAGSMFFPGATPMAVANLSAKKTIRFWAKGDGKTYRVMVFTQSAGRMGATQTFEAGGDWKEFSMPLAEFQTDGHDMMGLLFTGGPAGGAFSFEIDDVRIE